MFFYKCYPYVANLPIRTKGSPAKETAKGVWQSRDLQGPEWESEDLNFFFNLAHGTSSPEDKRKVPQIKNPGPEGNVGSWDLLPSKWRSPYQVLWSTFQVLIVRSWDLRDLPGGGRSHRRSHRRVPWSTYQVLRVLYKITSLDLFWLWRLSRWTKTRSWWFSPPWHLGWDLRLIQ